MSPEKQREIASKGGRAAHEKGTAHEWTADEARNAGRKGGQVSRGGRGRLDRAQTDPAIRRRPAPDEAASGERFVRIVPIDRSARRTTTLEATNNGKTRSRGLCRWRSP